MLRKVLKHDLKSIYKLWIVISVTALVLGTLGGVALRVLLTPTEGPEHFTPYKALAAIFMLLAIIGIIAYFVICYIFVIYRYYQNFFTDEGYLTFTLPVSRYTLLNAKLINAFIWETATGIVFIASFVIMLLIAPSSVSESGSLLSDMFGVLEPVFKVLFAFTDGWFWAFLVGFILFAIAYYVFSTLLVYLCVTIGCIVAKKAKALVAILVYYAASTVISTASYIIIPTSAQIAAAFGILSVDLGYDGQCLLWFAALISVTMGVLLLAIAEYKFILGRIENKLNLA